MLTHTHTPQDETYIAHVRALDDHERRISDLEEHDSEITKVKDRMEKIERTMENVSGKFDVILKIVYGMITVSIISLFGMVVDFIRTRIGG